MATTLTCPNCGTVFTQQPTQACAVCFRRDFQAKLYTLRAGGVEITLCLDCLQRQVWNRATGPSETKHIGVNPYD